MLLNVDWHEHAACRGAAVDLFFPDEPHFRSAKEVCARCEVREECLDFALRNGEQFGVWGGLAPQERRNRFG